VRPKALNSVCGALASRMSSQNPLRSSYRWPNSTGSDAQKVRAWALAHRPPSLPSRHLMSPMSEVIGLDQPARYLSPAKSCVTQVPREEPFRVCQPEMPAILGNLPSPKREQASKPGGRPKTPTTPCLRIFYPALNVAVTGTFMITGLGSTCGKVSPPTMHGPPLRL